MAATVVSCQSRVFGEETNDLEPKRKLYWLLPKQKAGVSMLALCVGGGAVPTSGSGPGSGRFEPDLSERRDL